MHVVKGIMDGKVVSRVSNVMHICMLLLKQAEEEEETIIGAVVVGEDGEAVGDNSPINFH